MYDIKQIPKVDVVRTSLRLFEWGLLALEESGNNKILRLPAAEKYGLF